ncbi:MAG: prepilin peptidase [Halobellus sp.]|uniref:A24 family peptidase n=1 Tax=Halobellus sp. TaxID=1979212 RepID=UPI0035D52294
MFASVPDILRLVVVPVLGWAAWRDVETRRVPSRTWLPLVALGVVLLAWDALGHLSFATSADLLFFIRVGISLFLVAPLSYLFWRLGGFGGADAKALITIAILLPTFPTYLFSGFTLPIVVTTLGVFSMTVLTNTVLLAVLYPLGIAVRNLLDGDFRFPVGFLGRRMDVASLPTAHGRLYETPDGFSRHGLDLDALRMYLRWRGASLSDLRADPDTFRDPASIDATYPATDGAVGDEGAGDGVSATTLDSADVGDEVADGAGPSDSVEPIAADPADEWGAAAFLDGIEGTAYGTSPEKLRGGLDIVAERDDVWVSPGIPFIVPMFAGTFVAFTYGDLVFGLLGAIGIV